MSDLTNTFRVFFPSSSVRASGLIAAFAFLICLFAAQSAQAQLTVTRTDDRNATCVSGNCSLREAVKAANAAATNDTINFAISAASCPAGVCTITLGSEIEITSNGSLSINGTGAKSLIINGGGIRFAGGTDHRIENSTFSGNSANDGGGIVVTDASLTVVNTTLTGNTASSGVGVGGGIVALNSGTLTLRGDTISANTADQGGGVFRNSGTLDFGDTIIAGNTGTTSFPEIYFVKGTATSQGFNLVGDSAGDSTATLKAITYQPTDILDTPPLLDPLADYGGTTPTRRLQTGSPAIDKGNSFGLTTDQRGFTRPVDNPGITNATGGDGADIGAFEVQAGATAATVSVGGRVMTSDGRGIRNVVIRLTDSQGNVRTAISKSFGYYRFTEVAAGETYVISATGKRYTFSQPSQVLNITEDTEGINFVGNGFNNLLFDIK